MTPTSVTASSPSPAVDWMAVLSRLSNTSTSGQGGAASFDATLGQLLSNRSGSSRASLSRGASGHAENSRVERSRVAAADRKENGASAREAKESSQAAREGDVRPGRVSAERKEPTQTESTQAADDALSAQDSSTVADGGEQPTQVAAEGDEGATGEAKRSGGRGKAGDGQEYAGEHGVDLSEQVLARLQRLAQSGEGGLLSAHGAKSGQGALTPEELMLHLSLLGLDGQSGAGEGAPVPTLMAEAGNKAAAALLPTASMALLAEKMIQARTVSRAGGSEEVAEVLGKLQAVGDAGMGTETALRAGANGRATGSSGPLSAESPQFADELMDRVGKMRLLTRSGMTDQLRVTLDPEDLGTIDLRLRVDGQNQVHLLITTQSELTKDLLHRQLGQLREALARQEMGFGEVVVQVGDQGQQDQYAAAQWSFADQQAQRENLLARGSGRLGVETIRVIDPIEVLQRPMVSAADGVSIIV
ncbi:MAG: flagellar hook-length control protein FliK [Magnetococcales bacterium]|nr:flagellar hook-length control protein FliK [Magnetococcales bacterium]MBF0116296.1 flagellar hook-length control protein FliK [Magnetococcales bacterium]